MTAQLLAQLRDESRTREDCIADQLGEDFKLKNASAEESGERSI